MTGSFRLRPTSPLRIDDGGRRLTGGAPLRSIVLSEAGAQLVAGWFAGESVGPAVAHRELARRLIEADMATVMADGDGAKVDAGVAVVIPVKDDAAGLAATLTALGSTGAERCGVQRIVVVDDGSQPMVDPSVGAVYDLPITVIRRSTPTGPGNARNLGVAELRRDGAADWTVIVFVDAGVRVTGEQIATLVAEVQAGDTVAAAPRVRSEPRRGRLARYERSWSPLDMGPDPALVGPGRRLPYVPSTCLAVGSATYDDVGGFDPAFRYGEDVDLVWRLGGRGWVRYVPEIEVTHPPRATLAGFIRQRFRYGTSAAPLAVRHGRWLAPARLDRRSAMVWTVLLGSPPFGRRSVAAVAALATGDHIRWLTRQGVPPRTAARLTARGWLATAQGLSVATARVWWPVAAATFLVTGSRRLLTLLGLGWARRLRRSANRRQTGLDLALGIVDDSAYSLGVWRGSLSERTTRALLPDISGGRAATER